MDMTLSLPPLYDAVVLPGDAVLRDEARRLLRAGAEAGTFVWRPDPGRLDCAVILRPDEPAAAVRPAVLVAALALSDAVGAVGSSAVPLDLVWPGTVRVNRGAVGGIAMAIGPGAGPDGAADWAVLEVGVQIAEEQGEGGDRPDVTSLAAEGVGRPEPARLAEAFARNLLVWMDRWEEGGMSAIAPHWMRRATSRGRDTVLTLGGELLAGTVTGLDESGGLELQTRSGRQVLSLGAADLDSVGG